VEPKTSQMPVAGTESGRAPQGGRLLVASRLATALSQAGEVEMVADEAVRTLHESFDYYLAVVQRLDPDGVLRVVSAAGPLAEVADDFLATEQRIEDGVNGRVARSARAAPSTRKTCCWRTSSPARSAPRSTAASWSANSRTPSSPRSA
jgi:hypothetical protein